jgi:2-haloacid dehalogenase
MQELQAPKVILLDVYETLLDMTEVRRKVNHLLDSKSGYLVWLELFMQYTFVDNSTKQFHDFISIADATLQMSASIFNRDVNDDDRKEVIETLKHVPLQEGAQRGLSGLSDQQFRIAALTNCPESIVQYRMQPTGLISYFEMVLSAEQARRYKPAREVYRWAAEKLNVPVSDILMVSSHGWDIAGADNAGLKTAYIQQDHQLLYPLAPTPHFICKNIPDLCEQLLQLRRKQGLVS